MKWLRKLLYQMESAKVQDMVMEAFVEGFASGVNARGAGISTMTAWQQSEAKRRLCLRIK